MFVVLVDVQKPEKVLQQGKLWLQLLDSLFNHHRMKQVPLLLVATHVDQATDSTAWQIPFNKLVEQVLCFPSLLCLSLVREKSNTQTDRRQTQRTNV